MRPEHDTLAHLPKEPGTYALILGLENDTTIPIGRLGQFDFPAGYYIYVGSAFGPGGLSARLRRHVTGAGRRHWHIDYLRQGAIPLQIWFLAGPPHREHAWARLFEAMEEAATPVPGFGASDCRCPAHLFHFGRSPSWNAFSSASARHYPNDTPTSVDLALSRVKKRYLHGDSQRQE